MQKPHLVYLAMAMAISVLTPPAWAGDPKPFADFTFRRVGVPQPGESRRITVQIDPAAPQPAPAVDDSAVDDPGTAAPRLSGYEWFWQVVSPEIGAQGPQNLTLALAELNKSDAVSRPRLQALQDISSRHGTDILRATVGTPVSPALVLALISIESGGRAAAESSAGAHGLMQLMPATAERFGVEDTGDTAQNIKGGVAYLAWLLQHFDGDPILALAGYNAGENAVRNHGGVPPYAETRAYVPKVLSAWQVARGLCLTVPELITDGCVFTTQRTATNG